MNNNRRKGHNAERYYVQIFKELFPECQTSRYASRMLDDAGVDIAELPLLVQIKAGLQKGLKPVDILQNINSKIPNSKKELPKLCIHHKQGVPGKKRDEYSSIVTMTFDDFFKILKLAYDNKIK